MKKCASCSKDLPDAALHCVFCGSKQPPAPATAGGLAKTVMGSYSANDVIDQLRGQQGGGQRPGPPPAPSYGAPPAGGQPPSPYQRPGPGPTPGPPMGAPQVPPGPGMAPGPTFGGGGPRLPGVAPMGAPQPPPGGGPSAANAATMYVPGPAAPPQGGYGGPAQQGGFGGSAQQGGYGGPGPGGAAAKTIVAAPQPQPQPQAQPQPFSKVSSGGGSFGPTPPSEPGVQVQPFGGAFGPSGQGPYAQPAQQRPLPQPMQQPYLGAAPGNRPIEPWKDSLRLMMFVWGGLLLLVFVTPLQIEPLRFSWDAIMLAEGKAKLPPLLLAAIGLLSIVLALIPTSPVPRGLIAGVLGLAGLAVPIALTEVPPWQVLVPMVGSLLLIPGLLIREEYRESLLPRFMVTFAVIAVLLPMLLPANDRLPLVDLFKAAIDLPGKAKVTPLLDIAFITLIVLTLLAWLPAPATGGAKVFAWILLLWPAVPLLTGMILRDEIVDAVTKTPNSVIAWAGGTAYAVLVGYGFATVLGKRLE